jgi:hypothetical protein
MPVDDYSCVHAFEYFFCAHLVSTKRDQLNILYLLCYML